jgi:hypothetical protein
MKIGISRHISEKYWNIKFHEYPSSGGRFVEYGSTEGQSDLTTFIVAFCNFAREPKNQLINAEWGNDSFLFWAYLSQKYVYTLQVEHRIILC